MRWSFRIATVLGTEVRIHATFGLLIAFAAWQAIAHGEGSDGAIEAVLLVCAMFTCVLLHEFGHVLAASRFGIQTPDITLLPIGGVARLERMPRKPQHELVVAVCGPLVNVIIAAGIGIALGIRDTDRVLAEFMVQGRFWQTLMMWNAMMVMFNMVPAFPMDGGRVLRATLAWFTGDYAKATRWAAAIGQALAVITVTIMLASGTIHPMLLLIAFFVFFAAGQEAAMVSQQEETHGLRVGDVMLTEFETLPDTAVLREAVDRLLGGTQHDFPVVDDEGHTLGMLTRKHLIEALAEHGPGYPAQLVMDRCPVRIEPTTPLSVALESLHIDSCPSLPVMDPKDDQLVGLLTAENIGEVLLVRAAMKHRSVHAGPR